MDRSILNLYRQPDCGINLPFQVKFQISNRHLVIIDSYKASAVQHQVRRATCLSAHKQRTKRSVWSEAASAGKSIAAWERHRFTFIRELFAAKSCRGERAAVRARRPPPHHVSTPLQRPREFKPTRRSAVHVCQSVLCLWVSERTAPQGLQGADEEINLGALTGSGSTAGIAFVRINGNYCDMTAGAGTRPPGLLPAPTFSCASSRTLLC